MARPTTPNLHLDVRSLDRSSRSSPEPELASSPRLASLRRASTSSGQTALGLGTPPLHRVPSSSSSTRVVGLGLVDGSEDEAPGARVSAVNMAAQAWPAVAYASTSSILLSPTNLASPEIFASPVWPSNASNIVPTSVASRSPRSSIYLDPPATTSARRSSLTGHISQSSASGSGASPSAVSICVDGVPPEDAAHSASASRSHPSGYWMPGGGDEASPLVTKDAERDSKRGKLASVRNATTPRSVLQFLLGPFSTLLLPSAADHGPPSKRALPTRLLNAAYVIFSFLFLTSHILAPYASETRPMRLLRRASKVAIVSDDTVKPRQWGLAAVGAETQKIASPLSSMRHHHRFSKLNSKVDDGLHGNINPFVFRATSAYGRGDVTACMYTNEAWLSELPEFTRRWGGPVSAVYEIPHDRSSPEYARAIGLVAKARNSEPLLKQLVDLHVLAKPPSSALQANRTRSRLEYQPSATNFQLNTARLFSRTSMVWLAGDPRLLPSVGLRKRLNTDAVARLVLDAADAVVIPVFAALRQDAVAAIAASPSLAIQTRDLDDARPLSDMAAAHRASLPLPYDRWPKKKTTLVGLSSVHPPQSVMGPDEVSPPGPVFALWDRSWEANRGPSNWPLWRRSSSDPRLVEGPDVGGGAGLGIAGTVGGGGEPFRVADYDLHYAPAVVIGREQQPWCTERFGANKAACIYQMYLAGAELWVLPDEWAFTLEAIEPDSAVVMGNAEKTQNSIASRLYTKFHQEACMHYGREFLSLDQWSSARAAHLRATCAKVLSSWGVGAASE